MKKLLLIVLSFTLLIKCSSEKKEANNTEEESKVPGIIKNTLTLKKHFGNCETDTAMTCTRVRFNLPYLEGADTIVSSKINTTIQHYVLSSYLSDSINNSFEAYADQFIEDYKNIKSKFGESFGWYTIVEGGFIRHDDSLMVIELDVKMYTGGAHGTDATYYLNFNLNNGKLLTLDDVFTTNYENTLNEIAHNIFQHKIKGKSLENYQFENSRFYNDNFGLLPEGLKFYYNAYEIAPYSSGSTEILIPYKKLDSILKWKLYD